MSSEPRVIDAIAGVLKATADLRRSEAVFVLEQALQVTNSICDDDGDSQHAVLRSAIDATLGRRTQVQRLLLAAYYLENQGQESWTGPELNHCLSLINREVTAVSARIIELTKNGLVEPTGTSNGRTKLLRLTAAGNEEARLEFPGDDPVADESLPYACDGSLK